MTRGKLLVSALSHFCKCGCFSSKQSLRLKLFMKTWFASLFFQSGGTEHRQTRNIPIAEASHASRLSLIYESCPSLIRLYTTYSSLRNSPHSLVLFSLPYVCCPFEVNLIAVGHTFDFSVKSLNGNRSFGTWFPNCPIYLKHKLEIYAWKKKQIFLFVRNVFGLTTKEATIRPTK